MVSTEPRRKATSDGTSRLVRWLRATGRAVLGSATAGPGLARWRRQPVRVRAARRGISLLEVLLSMFILTVGLLGVAALIPVGRYDLNQAAQADRGSTVGRAAFREVQIRGMLEPEMWATTAYDPYGGTPVTIHEWFDVDEDGLPRLEDPVTAVELHPLVLGNSLCIDPLFVARGFAGSYQEFPYRLDNDPDPDPATAPSPPRMARGTLKAWPDQSTAPLAPPLGVMAADRIFRWQDDVLFQPVAHDEEGRPAQVFDATSTPQFLGDYSWLITLTPNLDWRTGIDLSFVPHSYTASVVVFQRRVFDRAPEAIADRAGTLPTERMVYADLPFGAGLGTADVLLRLSAGTDNPVGADPAQSDFPAVKAGQWILLCGWLRSDPADTTVTSLFADNRMWATFRWYRVTSVDELTPVEGADNVYGIDEWQQYVTVEGPPLWSADAGFDATYFDADEDATAPTLHAVIVDGVVGVYEKTVQLPE